MKTGREAEAKLIRQANRAAAVGRLMLGQMSGWHEFLDADSLDLASLPRRQLKSGAADAKKRMSPEIKRFCSINFENMTEAKLSQLYEEIKAHRGIEFPLKEFEQEYSKVLPRVIAGFPTHCTVVFSLWGLQIKFPEDILSKDIYEAINTAHEADAERIKYRQDRAKYVNKFITHGAAPETSGALAADERSLTLERLESCHKTIYGVASFINGQLLWESSIGGVPVPQYDQLKGLDKRWHRIVG